MESAMPGTTLSIIQLQAFTSGGSLYGEYFMYERIFIPFGRDPPLFRNIFEFGRIFAHILACIFSVTMYTHTAHTLKTVYTPKRTARRSQRLRALQRTTVYTKAYHDR